MTYQTKVYIKQGGEELVVASGGKITVESGGTIENAGALSFTGTQSFDDIVGNDASLGITGKAGSSGAGGAVAVAGGAGDAGAGGAVSLTGGAGNGTGAGGAASLVAGASGAGATGNGGAVSVTGGAAASTNGNGGSIFITAGAKAGSGVDGVIIERSVKLVKQGAPSAKTVSATLTAAEVLTGIITVAQGAGATSALQLPLAADMDTAIPDAAAGDAFDFSVINTSTVDAEDASLTTHTGWTLVGNMDIPAYSAAGSLNSSGRFRARKTGAGAWALYRLS
jgi:hypothetical protein